MPHLVILDESGDLGWEFSHPYRRGGSSRYLTIGYIICPEYLEHHLHRIVKRTYRKFNFLVGREKKGAELHKKQRDFIVGQVIRLLDAHPEIRIGAITTNKEMVKPSIRKDGNLLYNYMIKLAVLDKISTRPRATFFRDERTIKVNSGNSCIEYLQTTLWFDMSSETSLIDVPTKSHTNLSVILVDWICNMSWMAHEDGIHHHLGRLKTNKGFDFKKLFF